MKRHLPLLTLAILLASTAFGASGASAQSSGPVTPTPRLDEGYTWFQLTDVEEPVNGARTWMG